MRSDLYTLQEMFKRRNIGFDVGTWNYKERGEKIQGFHITVEDGYIGFYSVFVFDIYGNLKSVEAYE